jgi:hypothetical protein
MASRLVVGLFHSSGIADDAVHRLMTEGVAPRDIARRVLKEVAPIPPILQSEIAALEVDPLVLGNVRYPEAVRCDHNRNRAPCAGPADTRCAIATTPLSRRSEQIVQ